MERSRSRENQIENLLASKRAQNDDDGAGAEDYDGNPLSLRATLWVCLPDLCKHLIPPPLCLLSSSARPQR